MDLELINQLDRRETLVLLSWYAGMTVRECADYFHCNDDRIRYLRNKLTKKLISLEKQSDLQLGFAVTKPMAALTKKGNTV